jgi:hypothetical protein
MTRRDLLRRWLRGKGYHPQDIATALAWYDAEVSAGRSPKDADVVAQCDAGHGSAVERYGTAAPREFIVRHEHRLTWRLLAAAFAGSALAQVLGWALALTR